MANDTGKDRNDDRSGVRNDTGSSMTDMQGRERHTNSNQAEKPESNQMQGQQNKDQQNNSPSRTDESRQVSNDRNVTAHNTGDQFRDRKDDQGQGSGQEWNKNDQQRRKAS